MAQILTGGDGGVDDGGGGGDAGDCKCRRGQKQVATARALEMRSQRGKGS